MSKWKVGNMQIYVHDWDCDQKIALLSVSPTENITFLDFFKDWQARKEKHSTKGGNNFQVFSDKII